MTGARFRPAAAALTALLLAAGCAPRLPVERPVRVHEAERGIVIWLDSEPTGAEVWEHTAAGERGELLGRTPLELDRLALRKELWKYSDELPPAPEDEGSLASYERSDGGKDADVRLWGEGYRREVLLSLEGWREQRVDVRLSPSDMPEAFSQGQRRYLVTLERPR